MTARLFSCVTGAGCLGRGNSHEFGLLPLVGSGVDKRDQRLMGKRVGVALRAQRDNGAVVALPGPGQFVLWEIAR